MKATEAKRKLYEINSNLTDDEQREAISVAILAIETCERAYLLQKTNHPEKDINISNMEEISLEDKVSETLGWLANQIACTQVYKKWDEEFKKESLNAAWQKVQEQFKKDIDWNALTESQCESLHFGSWESEEDVEEEISCLQSELDKGHFTKEEFDKKVANEKNTLGLRLIPLYLYPSLPIGITLTSIGGEERVFDGSNISTDVRFGCLAWGIKPKKD